MNVRFVQDPFSLGTLTRCSHVGYAYHAFISFFHAVETVTRELYSTNSFPQNAIAIKQMLKG
jgi:hypothetical protein